MHHVTVSRRVAMSWRLPVCHVNQIGLCRQQHRTYASRKDHCFRRFSKDTAHCCARRKLHGWPEDAVCNGASLPIGRRKPGDRNAFKYHGAGVADEQHVGRAAKVQYPRTVPIWKSSRSTFANHNNGAGGLRAGCPNFSPAAWTICMQTVGRHAVCLTLCETRFWRRTCRGDSQVTT
jgi:hypothetical protein